MSKESERAFQVEGTRADFISTSQLALRVYYYLHVVYKETNSKRLRDLPQATHLQAVNLRFKLSTILPASLQNLATERESFSFNIHIDFPGGSVVKDPSDSAGDVDSSPGVGRSPGEGNSNPPPYYCLEISWTEEPRGLHSIGSQRSQRSHRITERACTHLSHHILKNVQDEHMHAQLLSHV